MLRIKVLALQNIAVGKGIVPRNHGWAADSSTIFVIDETHSTEPLLVVKIRLAI